MEVDRPGRKIVGQRIKAIRLERGLTLTQLGTRTGLSHPFLSQVENSQTFPSFASFFDLADALDVRPAQLLGE
jgi:transcriptional regulator with XRE-family HTH domain